ncbi:MAG: J domain-containing protein [Polyangiaceae bacterium]|nr:J domain-containing protein [Polyangiaceae bacterium]
MAEDLYTTLGVAKGADGAAIKKAYRKLAKDLHPDKNPGNAKAEARFKEVNHAFEVLSNPDKRKLYDEFGEEGLRDGFDADRVRQYRAWQGNGGGGRGGGQRVNLEDLFGGGGGGGGPGVDSVFGDIFGRSAGRRGPRPGPDLETELRIDFAAAVRGTTITLRPNGQPVTVRIPPGAEDGSRLRLTGYGAPSNSGGPSGDLIILVHVDPHAFFQREGDDLRVNLPISVTEAFFGAKVKVPTIDAAVSLKVPERTQSGAVLRLRGKGVQRQGKEPGDLYVHFEVKVPKGSDPELLAIMEKLKAFEEADVRAELRL